MLFVYTLQLSTQSAGRCVVSYAKSAGTGSGRGNADVTTSSLYGGPTSVSGRGNADVSTSLGAVSGRYNADVTTSSLDGGGRVGGRGNADISTSSHGGGATCVGGPVGIYTGCHGNVDVIVD